ncbi:hypothetical protein EM20IM_00970 [Candidatus Methylacidiphilum infernorum]|uniref:Uncharacterized protein n=1 Tax=Candidatus Methylacidiphilum infernorum TaxID=511746 RepID=A0ABX7PVG2_9BACT|nr:hypothetical protein [Candidatus Methylacidiphilum infernorum]QSR86977.1 hypothetical protein EM20IM_00970 [Candidatus Methylacidiphilum infernorum]
MYRTSAALKVLARIISRVVHLKLNSSVEYIELGAVEEGTLLFYSVALPALSAILNIPLR